MKNAKRFLCGIVAVMLLICLCACGKNSEEKAEKADTAAAETEKTAAENTADAEKAEKSEEKAEKNSEPEKATEKNEDVKKAEEKPEEKASAEESPAEPVTDKAEATEQRTASAEEKVAAMVDVLGSVVKDELAKSSEAVSEVEFRAEGTSVVMSLTSAEYSSSQYGESRAAKLEALCDEKVESLGIVPMFKTIEPAVEAVVMELCGADGVKVFSKEYR